jgi:hypothetical protein
MNIDSIINSTITRSTPVATLPGFGVPAILAQFAASKTTATFSRHRYYSSTTEMTADGWASTDSVFQAAQKLFAQSPRPERIMVGRIDSGDASIAASGDLIRAEQDDWYTFDVVGNRTIKFTLSADLSASNVISSSISGTTIAQVTYATSHVATMALWKTAIEAAITGATATVSGRDMTVVLVGKDMHTGTFSVAGGTAVTATTVETLDATKTKAWMAWAETQVKAFGFTDSDAATLAANTGVSGTACLIEFAKLMSYKRTIGIYKAAGGEYAWSAWCGSQLPQPVGSRLWAFANLAGVTPDSLTTSQVANVQAKNGNCYTSTASYSHTYAGICADGNQIDQLRGLDYINSQIQINMFNLLVQNKVTISKLGQQQIYSALSSTLILHGEDKTILETGSTVVIVPAPTAVPAPDRAAGVYSGITWSAILLVGALRLNITGTVSV